MSANASFLFFCCYFAALLFTLDAFDDVPHHTCDYNKECEIKTNGESVFCCGDCGASVCCNNSTRELNVSKCETEEKEIEGSASMLGFIIGGMVGSFVLAMSSHYLIKKLIQKIRKMRNGFQPQGNGTTGNDPHTTTIAVNELPPLYEDIQLYRKLESRNVQRLHHTEEVDEIKIKTSTLSEENILPPSYSSIFSAIEEENKQHNEQRTAAVSIQIPDSTDTAVSSTSE
uniref:uncharacterized protein LOC120347481 n=1 Tax=Styela clava TaxID=7725 RepID=UPI0019392F0A|nr:uncharacterized protein LOC120347481 [Styela clava]